MSLKRPRLAHRLLLLILFICLAPAGLGRAEAPPAPPSLFHGIQMTDSIAELAALPDAQTAGIRYIRFNLRWDDVEPVKTAPPTYQWAKYDRLIGDMTRAGFSLIITVRDNPAWAASTPCGPIDIAPNRFSDFLTTLLSRYGGAPYHVRLWELYNEPDNNHPEFAQLGGCWGQHAAQYAALLQSAAPIVRAAGGQLVLGGLALDYIEGVDEGGIFNKDFLKDLLDNGGGGSFDIMNFHYYRAFAARWAPYGRDVIGKTNWVKARLAERGLQNKPIMVTEIGDPSEGPAGDNQDYSDARSSRYVVQGLTRGLYAELHSITWYQMVDVAGDPRKYGLLRSDYTPKPAYYAYQTHVREIGGLTKPTQTISGQLERYTFNAGDRQKIVAWVNAGSPLPLTGIAGRGVWLVDKLGGRQIIWDGQAGDLDRRAGYIGVQIGIEPAYIYPVRPKDLPRALLPVIRRAAR